MVLRRALSLISILCLQAFAAAWAQVTIVISRVPDNTPKEDTLYLAASINSWDPGNRAYQFEREADGSYRLNLPQAQMPFVYKITRGNWTRVEGDVNGNKLGDREIPVFQKPPFVANIQVLSWEDLSKSQTWNITVQSIPATTPPDASLYLSGSFNGWSPNDPAYRLQRQDDGSYTVHVPRMADTLTYKFCRGRWSTVERRDNGKSVPNRLAIWKGPAATDITVTIDAWQDIPGGRSTLLIVVLAALGLTGMLFLSALFAAPNREMKSIWPLTAFLGLISLACFARLSVYDHSLLALQPWLYPFSDIVLVLYGPALYLLIRSVMGIPAMPKLLVGLFAFGLAGMLLVSLPMIAAPKADFLRGVAIGRFADLYRICGGVCTLYNVGLLLACYRLVSPSRASTLREERYRMARSYAIVSLVWAAFLVGVWLFADLFYLIDFSLFKASTGMVDALVDLLWVLMGMSVLVQGYLYLRNPALFQSQRGVSVEVMKERPNDDLADFVQRLTEYMKNDKPFLNPRLTLDDLAEGMHINLSTLSWVLHEGVGQNFYDYINRYRIDAFLTRIKQEKYKHYTFLAVAFESGFNSKTTFNRVFKKHMDKTPREYLGASEEADI